MLFHNTVEVKFIEYQRGADFHACEQRTKMFIECAAFDTKVIRRLLAVIAALIHD
jgi:hypothetical protein